MPTPSTAPHQVRILPMAGADAARFLAVDESAFFFDRTGVTLEQATAQLDWSRCFAATPDPAGTPAGEERLAGVYASYDMALSAPGPQGGCSPVRMSGLTWVGVHPDHRRRGVLRAMIRHHLDEVHESGLVVVLERAHDDLGARHTSLLDDDVRSVVAVPRGDRCRQWPTTRL